MIRQPTNLHAALEWHRRALAGDSPPVHEDAPQCGWYRRRFVPGGPWVPARIWIHQVLDPETGELAEPEMMLCEVNGREVGAMHEWTWLAKNPITEEQFDRMTQKRLWAEHHDPMNPILRPDRPMESGRVSWPGGS